LRVGLLVYLPGVERSAFEDVVRGVEIRFENLGGVGVLRGNLGMSLILLWGLKPLYLTMEARAVVVVARMLFKKLHAGGMVPLD
ncbi:phosphogluconate dehydratase, partial [Stenotrophomonas maltophilia]